MSRFLLFVIVFLTFPWLSWQAFCQSGGDATCTTILHFLSLSRSHVDDFLSSPAKLDSAYAEARQARLLSHNSRLDSLEALALQLEGRIWIGRSNADSAWMAIDAAAAIYHSKGDKAAEARVWRDATEKWPVTWKPSRDAMIEAHLRAYNVYRELNDNYNAAEALKFVADCHISGNKLALAKKELLEVLDLYRAAGYPKLYFTYDLLRAVSQAEGDIAGQIFYAIRMIGLADSIPTEKADLAYFNIRIAEAYRDAGMNTRSLPYSEKAYKFSQAGLKEVPPVITAATYALDLVENDSPGRAIAVVAPFDKTATTIDVISRAEADYIRCLAYTRLNKPALAEQFGLRVVGTADSFYCRHSGVFSHHAMTSFYATLSEAWITDKQFKKASLLLDKIPADPSAPVYLVDQRRLALARSRIDSGMGNFESALQHYQTYKRCNDSLYGIEKAVSYLEISAKYESERKDKDILFLQQQNELQKQQASQARYLRNSMAVGAGTLLIFSILLYSRFRNKRRHAEQLQQQKSAILVKNSMLEKLLQENEWLLREVHHRVKNNLQMVTGLLKSQTHSLTDPGALNAMIESHSRVHAMSLIHQKLYSSSDLSVIEMQGYTADLIADLREMARPGLRIVFDVQVEKVNLDISQAIPVGLLLNEVIVNAIKHAFDQTADPLIRVWLRGDKGGQIEFLVEDNGRGLPAGFDPETGGAFGFRLIRGLAQELEARLSITRDSGTSFVFQFTKIPARIHEGSLSN